jgi:hypothetical protein
MIRELEVWQKWIAFVWEYAIVITKKEKGEPSKPPTPDLIIIDEASNL